MPIVKDSPAKFEQHSLVLLRTAIIVGEHTEDDMSASRKACQETRVYHANQCGITTTEQSLCSWIPLLGSLHNTEDTPFA